MSAYNLQAKKSKSFSLHPKSNSDTHTSAK